MLDYIRIACAVPAVRVGDTKKNAADICEFLKKADAQNVDLLVFPEMALTGYTCQDLFLQDALYEGMNDTIEALKSEFEPQGIRVFPISAVSKKGVKELLYYVNELVKEAGDETVIFEQEYFPEQKVLYDEPYEAYYDAENDEYVVEGPRIEKMLGYTNLESEKGFSFFQNFLKENGILEDLEKLGISEGDTVRMYGLSFDYYK